MNYTSEMEKAMHKAHGVGYQVYSQKHSVRIKVEHKREQNYRESKRLLAEINSKLHVFANE
ncbi:hypothetical protein [Neobacillus niacini]|uniref:hypothetical protein n=1 Tax=Neobacillus niacini TaxID=86668 RepID=UPI00285C0CCE|nr:hypothetical protein [Neobacillus niacini]MDR7000944.1 hypothetical protein [Neobacillus niacini]